MYLNISGNLFVDLVGLIDLIVLVKEFWEYLRFYRSSRGEVLQNFPGLVEELPNTLNVILF